MCHLRRLIISCTSRNTMRNSIMNSCFALDALLWGARSLQPELQILARGSPSPIYKGHYMHSEGAKSSFGHHCGVPSAFFVLGRLRYPAAEIGCERRRLLKFSFTLNLFVQIVALSSQSWRNIELQLNDEPTSFKQYHHYPFFL